MGVNAWQKAQAAAAIIFYITPTLFSLLAWWHARKIKKVERAIKEVTKVVNGHDRDG